MMIIAFVLLFAAANVGGYYWAVHRVEKHVKQAMNNSIKEL